MASPRRGRAQELPPDNVAQIVLFDAMAAASENDYLFDGLSEAQLFDAVIPRLRVLVPRELHNQGEESYLGAKVAACVEARVLQWHRSREGVLLLGPEVPKVRYPDGVIRDYTAGLEAARERLREDESRLRRGGFDVRSIVRSPADSRKSDAYRNLVASMREHGFLEQYPIIESGSGVVLDGRARQAAAAEADVPLRDVRRVQLGRRDTPLHQSLLVLHLNAERLTDEDVGRVHEAISSRTGRPWMDIDTDLALTQQWRRAKPKDYDAKLEVALLPYRDGGDPKVQVTTEGSFRVMLQSLLREAGVSGYERDYLRPFVAFEEARTEHSGQKAIFVHIADAIEGIKQMQEYRAERTWKVNPAWEDVRKWLLSLEGAARAAGPVTTGYMLRVASEQPPTATPAEAVDETSRDPR